MGIGVTRSSTDLTSSNEKSYPYQQVNARLSTWQRKGGTRTPYKQEVKPRVTESLNNYTQLSEACQIGGVWRTIRTVSSLAGILTLSLAFMAIDDEGIRLYRTRKFVEAEREFRLTLRKQPQDPQPRLYLARTLIELNRVSEALAELERLIEAQPSPEIEIEVGRLLRHLAGRRFHDLTQSDAGQAAISEIAGHRLEQERNFPAALAQYREAQKIESDRPGINYAMGSVLWKMNEFGPAEKHLRAELERSADHGMANFRLGQVLLATSREAEAIAPLARATVALPDRWEVRRELGKAYRKTGHSAEALDAWEAVAKARPDDDQVHFLLGGLYRELGRTALAKQEFSRHGKLLEMRRARPERR